MTTLVPTSSTTRTTTSLDAVAGALSDGTRRAILRLVRDDERSAGEIAGQFPQMSRPAVSQHLKVLDDAGLVSVRAAGKFRLFQARSEGMVDMWEFVDEMWTDHLGRLKMAAERAERSRRETARPAADDAFNNLADLANLADDRTGSHSTTRGQP